MSSESKPPTEPVEQTPIPSMLTNSAREMLTAFSDNILEIEAEASLDTWNENGVMNDYGITRKTLTRKKIVMDYHQIRSEHGAENPLTDNTVNRVLENIHGHLDDLDHDGTPDLAISKLRLRVESQEMKEASRAVSDQFDLKFVSDPAGDARQQTQKMNLGKGLYDELGFEYRNLNLRSVVETRAKFGEQADAKLMGWGGPGDVRPRCSNSLAQAVRNDVLPEDWRALKWYTIGEDNITELQSVETDRGGV